MTWNRAVATRFWRRSLISVVADSHASPKRLAWLPEDFTTNNAGKELWLNALDGVALELIRRIIPDVAQGADRVSRDVFRHHFRAVQLPETFRKEVLGSTLLQNLVKPLSRVALWVLPDPANVFIDLQNCSSSYPDKANEPAAVVDPGPRRRILDVETDLVDDILSSVEAEIWRYYRIKTCKRK